MTLTPTAMPASANRVQRTSGGVSSELATTSASAKKTIAIAICCGEVPQQAFPKKAEFKVVANAPSAAAKGESFNCRKNVQAPIPNTNRAIGVKNLEKPTGPKSQSAVALTSGDAAPPLCPISFRSSHCPVRLPGKRDQAAFCSPNGPSFEK